MRFTSGRDRVLTLARVAGCAFAALLLAGCASMMPPEMTAPSPAPADQGALDADGKPTAAVKPAPLVAPTFGAPKQIGDRPVMDAKSQTQMQSDLENLAKSREGDSVKALEAGQ